MSVGPTPNAASVGKRRVVIAQHSFDLSITDIAFVTYFDIVDKLSR